MEVLALTSKAAASCTRDLLSFIYFRSSHHYTLNRIEKRYLPNNSRRSLLIPVCHPEQWFEFLTRTGLLVVLEHPVHAVRGYARYRQGRRYNREGNPQQLHLPLTSSISIFFVVCLLGLPQVGGPFNGTYVVILMPQLGHFHFSGLNFGASSSCSSSSCSSSSFESAIRFATILQRSDG